MFIGIKKMEKVNNKIFLQLLQNCNQMQKLANKMLLVVW